MPKAKRTPDGWRRQYEHAKRRKQALRLDPEYRAKEAETARVRYHGNRVKYLAIARKWLEKNKEQINEKRRIWRRENPDLAKSRDKRHRETGIKYAIARVREGSMGLDELNQRIGEALARIDDRIKSEGTE